MRLRIQRQDGKPVAELRAQGGELTLVTAVTPAIEADIRRWLASGIVELVGPPGERHQKHTAPSEPGFFRAVLAHIRRLGFVPVVAAAPELRQWPAAPAQPAERWVRPADGPRPGIAAATRADATRNPAPALFGEAHG